MGWNICAWTSCLGGQKQDDSDEKNIQFIPVRTTLKYATENGRPAMSGGKIQPANHPSRFSSRPASPRKEPVKRQSPPVPPVVSVPPEPKSVKERDLPPLPPVSAVYELGMPTPHDGLTRSNSGRSTKTTISVKSRRRQTQNPDKHKSVIIIGASSDALRVEDTMPGISVEPGSENRRNVVRPLVLSIHEGDGNLEPLPDFTKRPSMPRSKTYDDSPIACNNREASEEQKARHRRSDSAPIPVPLRLAPLNSLEPRIRRKPISPQNSVSHSKPIHIAAVAKYEQQQQQTGTHGNPFELETPAVELSADPKSRTQSYYADAGAQLLVATLSEPPPVPDLPPNLSLNTSLTSNRSNLTTPTSKKHPFTPLTTWSSPVDDPSVSPITPGTIRGRERMTIVKRSRSMGPSSAPSRAVSMSNLKRRSFEAAPTPPLPVLPTTVYSALANGLRSRMNSLSKAGSTVDSSRRTSSNSSASETSSRSSHPSPAPQTIPEYKNLQRQMRSQLVSLNRNSAYAPIPLVPEMSPTAIKPPIPKLPPQAYTFSTPRQRQPLQSRTSELMRSISTENLRARRRSAVASAKKAASPEGSGETTRSKSTYYPVSEWSGDVSAASLTPASIAPQRSGSKKKRAANKKFANETLPPVPSPPFSSPSVVSGLEPEDIPLPGDNIGDDFGSDWDIESVTTLSTVANSEQRTESRVSVKSQKEQKTEEQIVRDEGYGMGLGSAYGVAY